MYVSVTLLRVKSLRAMPAFMKHVLAINKQMKSTNGLLQFRAGNRWLVNNYTFSVWNSKEDMMRFITSRAHLQAMKETKNIASLAISKGFETDEIPSWRAEVQKLFNQAKTKPTLA